MTECPFCGITAKNLTRLRRAYRKGLLKLLPRVDKEVVDRWAMSVHITTKHRQEVRELARSLSSKGKTPAQISEEVGLSVRSVRKILKANETAREKFVTTKRRVASNPYMVMFYDSDGRMMWQENWSTIPPKTVTDQIASHLAFDKGRQVAYYIVVERKVSRAFIASKYLTVEEKVLHKLTGGEESKYVEIT